MDIVDPLEKELKAEFHSLGISVDDSHVILCASICKRNNISPNDLVETWIAFALSNLSGDTKLSADNLLLMETKELISNKLNNDYKKPLFNNYIDVDLIDSIPVKKIQHDVPIKIEKMEVEVTPSKNENRCSYVFPPEVIHTYGSDKIPSEIAPLDVKPLVIPELKNDLSMFTTIKDEANILIDYTYQVIDSIMNNVNKSKDENDDNTGYYCGRIVQAPDSRLNPTSIKLHCPDMGDYLIDVSQLNDFSLFPGQVIIAKGIKTGTKIIASHIYDNGRLPLLNDKMLFNGKISVLVAAGPLIEAENDNFESVDYIAKCCKHLNPQAIVILGPLLNSKTFLSPESVNFNILYRRLLKHLREQIVRDIKIYCIINKVDRCSIPVYPTLPPNLDSDMNIEMLPDPALLNINGILMAFSTTDVLLHMAKHEVQKNCLEKFLRLSDHCIKQQTIYPLYPADLSVSIDYKLWGRYAMLSHSPHVIFFRSAFKYFVKESEGKNILINPGSMSAKKEMKTFSLVEIEGSDSKEWNPSSSVSVKIFKT